MKIKMFLFLLVAALLIGYANCHPRLGGDDARLHGTDTGNVGTPGPPSMQLESILCRKLANCFSPVLISCENKILSAPKIVSALGLNETQYQNLQAALSAVAQGQLNENPQLKAECLQKIENLSCQDQLVISSYNTTSIEDLSQTFKLLSADARCTHYLTP